MKITEVVLPFKRKTKTPDVDIGMFLIIDLDSGKILDTKDSKKAAEIEKRKLENWHKKPIGIQEI